MKLCQPHSTVIRTRSFNTLSGSYRDEAAHQILFGGANAKLSIPSAGRTGMKRNIDAQRNYILSLSIPSAGRTGMKPRWQSWPHAHWRLSIPSAGRTGMKHIVIAIENGHCAVLSIPSAGRTGMKPGCGGHTSQMRRIPFNTLSGSYRDEALD